ncbi:MULTISPECIES: DnaA regulatory inactivator Hda [unclassified Massilia]|uniref:DnaA regulatory inactivator Hda n=1 Tax=unclassified Massilia TaxID=2609279 RepID=UPI00177C8088|nr:MULTISPECIES: DnaA regulatory inactivator Hda [unclassified Massilia]MBD8532777.1 DnaA regulatory inactivator Hda [Massilia sp. CFBP 13647]MBD8676106.1 DnaA regulatory inactivator Hda [Massilia sp. CFBP 13721]
MKQLVLDLGAEPAHSLDTFQVGENAELAHLMHQFAQRASREHFAYLWGDTGAGKTHLLQALAATPHSRYIAADASAADFVFSPETTLYLLDDCDRLSATAQIDAFALFNQIREHGAYMVSTGPVPPAVLPVREDLRTRMGWGLIYLIHGLSDDQKIAALTQAAEARGLTLSASVLPYLLSHFKRDMRSLATMLDALDQYSLETQRPVTLPLLRDLLLSNPTDAAQSEFTLPEKKQ